MKIEKLTNNKIRIILNLDDLAKKNIDIHSLIDNNDKTHVFLKNILKQAQKEVDFNTDDSKLLIEAFISAEGFFILTFTKVKDDATERKVAIPRSKRNNPVPKVKRKVPSSASSTAVYQFNSFDEFCSFCTYICNTKLGDLKKFAKTISLYEFEQNYFLAFSGINKKFESSSLFYASVSEFAKIVSNSPCFISKLVEYGKVIYKNNAIKNGINFYESHIN